VLPFNQVGGQHPTKLRQIAHAAARRLGRGFLNSHEPGQATILRDASLNFRLFYQLAIKVILRLGGSVLSGQIVTEAVIKFKSDGDAVRKLNTCHKTGGTCTLNQAAGIAPSLMVPPLLLTLIWLGKQVDNG